MQHHKNCQRHIWLLAGTGEGPSIASALIDKGWSVSVSVVSPQASKPYLRMPSVITRVGALDGEEGIKKVLEESKSLHSGFDLVIDATHPFAIKISKNLLKVCNQLGQSILRFERDLDNPPGASLVSDLKELSDCCFKGRKVLMAIGSRHLKIGVSNARKSGAIVFARVFPTPENIRQALNCGIIDSNLAISRPSLDEIQFGKFERAICRHWSITDVVCRQSGGLIQKLWHEVCEKEDIQLWLISRPDFIYEGEVVNTFEALLDTLTKY